MEYDFSTIKLSVEEEKKLRLEFENNAMVTNPACAENFKKAVRAYKDFDFSQLNFLNEHTLLYKARDAFFEDEDLASRPLLFSMYIFYRNGYLDRDRNKIGYNKFEYDLTDVDMPTYRGIEVPQGFITEDGVLHTCGVDGHMWLYFFLNLSGCNTKNVVKYGSFKDPDTKKVKQKFTHFEKYDLDKSSVYLSKEQAIAMNNLRGIIDSGLSLEQFLKTKTENMGFLPGESRNAFESNFDLFYKLFPNDPLEKREFYEENFYNKYFFDK